jgi:putative iron-regulated protein
MSANTLKLSACLVVASGLLACSSDKTNDASVSRDAVVKNYAVNLSAGYTDSVADEQAFKTIVDAFVAAPTEETLATARQGWLDSRAHYMLTEGARFYDGPIDVDPPNDEALVNSWPLDEAYIDYTTNAAGTVDETVGIVNHADLVPKITADALDQANAAGGDENISAGYHAVEFLLWGQALQPVGPGERPATDYVIGGPRKNPDRRAAYLGVAVDGIIEHLTDVRDHWTPTSVYRTGFEADPDGSLTKIFTGLAKFSKGELGSQRIGAAYTSKERHDQHDCFSSQTLVDYDRDARGIQNLYMGTYGTADGPGLNDLVHAVNPDLDADLQQMIQASIDAIDAIPKPFEASIAGDDTSPGRVAILAALNALSAQGDKFGEAAAALGLTIQVDDPDDGTGTDTDAGTAGAAGQ